MTSEASELTDDGDVCSALLQLTDVEISLPSIGDLAASCFACSLTHAWNRSVDEPLVKAARGSSMDTFNRQTSG